MQRSPAAEVLTVPLYVILGILFLGATYFALSKNMTGAINELPNAIFTLAIIVVPSVLATLPAYGVSVYMRRKGMNLAKASVMFCIIVLLTIGFLLNVFEAGNKTVLMTVVMTAILTVLYAGLESRRPRMT